MSRNCPPKPPPGPFQTYGPRQLGAAPTYALLAAKANAVKRRRMVAADLEPSQATVKFWRGKLHRLFISRRRKSPQTLEDLYAGVSRGTNPQWASKIGILTALVELCRSKDIQMFDGQRKVAARLRNIYYEGEPHYMWEYAKDECVGYRWAKHKRGGIDKWNALRRTVKKEGKLAWAGYQMTVRTRKKKAKMAVSNL